MKSFPGRHAPSLGDHTREILEELGFDESIVERLEQREAKNRELMRHAIAQAETTRNRNAGPRD